MATPTPASGNARRDEAAFAAVVDAYQGPLLRYAARLLGNASNAEDVVQRAFIKCAASWKGPLEPSDDLSAWLYRVAHNEAIDHLRGETRLRKLHAEHGEECMSKPSESGEISERAENAAEALSRLSDRERQLVVLKVYEEKSYKEIAEITGLTVGNVGFILHTAIKKLAAMLATKEGK